MTRQTFWKFWLFTLLAKLVISAWLPLFSDETYYWVWSHHLQLSYYDHPPFIAWLIWLGHFLEPFGNMVRWPSVIFAHFSLWFWYILLKGQLAENKMKAWLGLALLTPLTGMGSIILTPDLPLIFFWSLALLAMDRAMNSKDLKWYLLLGAALGLGFCSKYHAVLFVPFLFIWIALHNLWRQVKWKYVPLTIGVGLLFCAPVLIWNFQNDWISFRFQLDHGLGSVWKPKYTWRYFYGQAALLFPPVIYWAIKTRKLKQMSWLPVFSWGPLLFFLFTSFKGKVEANWPSITYPSIIVLALVGCNSIRWARWTIATWLAALLLVCSHIAYPWLPYDHTRLKTYELVQYKTFAKIAESYRPFYSHTFQLASKIWYESKTPTYKLKGTSRQDFYDYQPESVPTEKHYFYATNKWYQLPEWAQKAGHKIINKFPIDKDHVLFEVKAP